VSREQELAIIRRAYAKQVLASVQVNDARVEAAFASVERECYLGPGPWPILRASGYVPTPDADPIYLARPCRVHGSLRGRGNPSA
jgi:protein-L-isoaspartate(D-aspartate) O-methyltransferase